MSELKSYFPNSHPFGLCEKPNTSRREVLIKGAAAGAAWAMMPTTALASTSASRDPRLLVIVLRGALDGMAAVPPIGDPHYSDLRGGFQLTQDNVIPLDNLFALNANMPGLAQLYRNGDAAIVHATSTSYRSRSHFDGQDILESGYGRAGGASGWLNRATASLNGLTRAKPPKGVSIGYSAPLIMQGDAPVMTWSPQFYPQPSSDTVQRILALYESREPELAQILRTGIGQDAKDGGERLGLRSANKLFLNEIDQSISFFSDPDGPRIAALSSNGWDTHAGQNPVSGRLATKLKILDKGIARLASGLAPIWNDTVVAIVTEFGRTAAINGTSGTDHGTGTCAFLIGGAVNGGRVIADWPGLAPGNLHDGRDLAPTIHINSVFKGLLRDHFGIDRRAFNNQVFPDSHDTGIFEGLLR